MAVRLRETDRMNKASVITIAIMFTTMICCKQTQTALLTAAPAHYLITYF
jgi:hypothetical protein